MKDIWNMVLFFVRIIVFSFVFWTLWLVIFKPINVYLNNKASTSIEKNSVDYNDEQKIQLEWTRKYNERVNKSADEYELYQKRMDLVLDRQEQQQRRFDAILSVWERQTGLRK
ncbi:hypothetical protein C7405_104174 [Paraburkholderia caballeronis]|uniref:hypothetical protein n=1 Tax=Paraburkholderia caballeronis TaxID=416943 RepID=UPI001065F67D|nr:hypothetical protein [Paraburkholderia caballeronis]TDV36265.1 hypothetical protein C7405_104174 [Paraburkholderia caballeronis]